jgi:hypothetical protein
MIVEDEIDLPLSSHSILKGAQSMSLVNILWAVVVILVILWLLGWLVAHIGGGLIHILLIIAVIILLYNIFVGMRRSA